MEQNHVKIEYTKKFINQLNSPKDWVIHMVRNGAPCSVCGEHEKSDFLDMMCNAHTHGMDVYNHQDFQIVLSMPDNEIGRILNTLGCMVHNGTKFNSGDLVDGIYDDCSIRLDEFEESGREVLRVIIPDKKNRFPDDPKCSYPYAQQALPEESMYHVSKKDIDIFDLGLTKRPLTVLRKRDISSVLELIRIRPSVIQRFRGMGIGSWIHLKRALENVGIVCDEKNDRWIDNRQ